MTSYRHQLEDLKSDVLPGGFNGNLVKNAAAGRSEGDADDHHIQ